MTIPENIFGILPTWSGIYALTILCFLISAIIFYSKVVRHVIKTQPVSRKDNILFRLWGLFTVGFGQQKVLQRTSAKQDRARLAHFIIFWGFLSFLSSYILFIYGNSLKANFTRSILGEKLENIYLSYIDILSGVFLIILIWSAVRRWMLKPSRLKFDLTQKPASAIIL